MGFEFVEGVGGGGLGILEGVWRDFMGDMCERGSRC